MCKKKKSGLTAFIKKAFCFHVRRTVRAGTAAYKKNSDQTTQYFPCKEITCAWCGKVWYKVCGRENESLP